MESEVHGRSNFTDGLHSPGAPLSATTAVRSVSTIGAQCAAQAASGSKYKKFGAIILPAGTFGL